MEWYLMVRELQVWAALIPCVLFVIGYGVTEFRKNDPASWYIMGWGVTCTAAFTLSALRLQFPRAEWTQHAGIVLGFMILVMVWWMLFALLWVWRKQRQERRSHNVSTNDSK